MEPLSSPRGRAQELVQLNVLKGMKDTLVSKELMGRASIPLRPLHDKPGEAVDAWYDLGKGEWSNEDGTVCINPRFCKNPVSLP